MLDITFSAQLVLRKLFPEYGAATVRFCCSAIQFETCGGANWFESFGKGVHTDES